MVKLTNLSSPIQLRYTRFLRVRRASWHLRRFSDNVQGQLRKSHEWVKASHRDGAANYKFPWRDILDDQVEAQGFINKNFEFTLDQTRILDLLTGHTLYNDTSVVLRELVQNGIHAVRAQRLTERTSAALGTGTVTVRWNQKTRVLEVQYNGTGMTQDIIEAHLLKVGSSRYQDAEFKKKYPDFAPISRFGMAWRSGTRRSYPTCLTLSDAGLLSQTATWKSLSTAVLPCASGLTPQRTRWLHSLGLIVSWTMVPSPIQKSRAFASSK